MGFLIRVEMPISKSGAAHARNSRLHVYSVNSQLTNN